MGEELADAQLVEPVGDGEHVRVRVVHVLVHVARFRCPYDERSERAVAPLTARVRVPEVRALVVRLVRVPERAVRRHRALRHVRYAVHVRRVALMMAVPVDGRRLLHHGVLHVHHDYIAQAYLHTHLELLSR